MKSKTRIKAELKKEKEEASRLLKLHLNDRTNNEMHLRAYNRVQERIFTLEWVLNKDL